MADDVQPGTALVVGMGHEPRCPGRIGGGEHVVAGPGVFIPAGVRLEVHRRQLPQLAAIVDAVLQAAGLLFGADLQPVLDEDDSRLDHHLFEQRHHGEKLAALFFAAEAHHPLDTGAVVPAAVEDHYLARGRQVAQVALHIHLGLFPLGRCRQRHHAEYSRADALGNGLDGTALAGAIAALEDNAHLQALGHHPFLQLHQFHMQLLEFLLVRLAAQFLRLVLEVFFPGRLRHGTLLRANEESVWSIHGSLPLRLWISQACFYLIDSASAGECSWEGVGAGLP
ncbi:hypothetical protein D3C75_823640 [compost metagenome]